MRAAERGILEHVFRLWPEPGEGVVAADAFGDQRDAHHLEHVVGVVVGAVRNRAAGGSQRRDGRNDASISRHRRLMRDDRPRFPQQRDVGLVDVAAVRRKQPRAEEAVPIEKRRRPQPMMAHHEIHFGAALRQVNRVTDVVLLGESPQRLQQLG